MERMHMNVPSNMYGLRRPKREVELSAKVPEPQRNVNEDYKQKFECLAYR